MSLKKKSQKIVFYRMFDFDLARKENAEILFI